MREYKAQLGCPPNPARIVNPRKKHTVKSPLMVVDTDFVAWYEGKERSWDVIELVNYLSENWPENASGERRTTPVILVTENPQKVLLKLHAYFKDHPHWNFALRLRDGERFHMDGSVAPLKVLAARDIGVAYFGFKDGKRNTRYFHPISPHDYFNTYTEWYPDLPDKVRLYKWGGEVRAWCTKNKLRFSGAKSGISGQLLRDAKFYPAPRRKVPRLTNEAARHTLPGNFYQTSANETYSFKRVLALDQENAHHYAAATLALPAANRLYARGRFATKCDSPYCGKRSPLFKHLLEQHGLFRVGCLIPRHLSGHLPPWAQPTGEGSVHDIYLYSNEIPFAESLGIEIFYISHCWTADSTDKGLAKFADWSTVQVKNSGENKAWLKPTLLSAYGLLGVRPRKLKTGYYRNDKGTPQRYNLGATPITVKEVVTTKEIQSPIANVIQRGMIEAEVRKLSIEMARRLSKEGHTIVAIHADCVMVKDEGNQLPLLEKPWRLKETLTHFRIVDGVSYVCDQKSVLPGRRRGVFLASG